MMIPESIADCIRNFKTTGTVFGDGQRNSIKLFMVDGEVINIKSFKVPNIINQIAYRYFRKTKARRSFEYATRLLENGIGTPQPLGYVEHFNWLGLQSSFYASAHLKSELTFRELVLQPDYPDHENILRQFTAFTFSLHEKGIEFLDHSPGNTLIKNNGAGHYSFYLVDLNRMNFHPEMSFELRMKNFARLTPKRDMIAIMSDEYAKYYPESGTIILDKMWEATTEFQQQFAKKQQLKKRLKFWKS